MEYRRALHRVSLSTLLCLGFLQARAANTMGLYVGGSVGQSKINATVPSEFELQEGHSAFKVLTGLRPIPLISTEFEYVDFGHPARQIGFDLSDVRMKGVGAFAAFHVPVPVIDFFVKAGVSRVESTSTSQVACPPAGPCPLFGYQDAFRQTNTGFAGGVGVQYKIGQLAVRAEYERFKAAGGNARFISAGATWKF